MRKTVGPYCSWAEIVALEAGTRAAADAAKEKKEKPDAPPALGKSAGRARMIDVFLPDIPPPGEDRGEPWFTERMRRIVRATGVTTQADMAALVHVRQSSVSDACIRRSIPSEWYIHLMENQGLNPLYLKWGLEPRRFMLGSVLPRPLADMAASNLVFDDEAIARMLEVLLRSLPDELAEEVAAHINRDAFAACQRTME